MSSFCRPCGVKKLEVGPVCNVEGDLWGASKVCDLERTALPQGREPHDMWRDYYMKGRNTQGLEGEVVSGNAGKDPKEALSVHTFLSP